MFADFASGVRTKKTRLKIRVRKEAKHTKLRMEALPLAPPLPSNG
jgi:hypothetical protein